MNTTFILINTGDESPIPITMLVSYFVESAEQPKIETKEFRVSVTTNEGFVQTVEFSNAIILAHEVFVILKKDNGGIITQQSFMPQKIDGQRIEIKFAVNKEVQLETAEEPSELSTPAFVYGRLLDKKGLHKMEEVQIIITAQKEAGGDFEPITTVKTEAQGYFVIEYPPGSFNQAAALIGLELIENPLPIRLEGKEVGPEQIERVFPRRVILVAEFKDSVEPVPKDRADCGCQSRSFEQKRVLEEFSYFSLVRTSEPAIKGFVLEDEQEITLEDVLKNLPFSIFELVEPIKKFPFILRDSPIKSSVLTPGTGGIGLRTDSGAVITRAASREGDEFVQTLRNIKIRKDVLKNFIDEEKAVTKDNIGKLFAYNEAARFRIIIDPVHTKPQPLGRVVLDENNTVDWDEEPTLYQAVEVAHGHLLQFKSEWIDDGYSLGDLLYSLPLAPGQKKQIVVFDWERRESASNVQSVDFEESLYNSLTRDRDILEIAKGTVSESLRGSSRATTGSASAGIGGVLGGILFGVSGGFGTSNSRASQDSFRQVSSTDQQKLRDRIVQSANAVRSLRSTVIQTVAQGERFEVSSETVANYNHCHAITIQYYEVLRHFKIRQRFAGARECLFVPLLMSQFDLKKALRWREALQPALLDKRLNAAFDAGERVEHEWKNSDFPSGTFASENVLAATGVLQVKFVLRRPADRYEEVEDKSKPVVTPAGVVYPYTKKVAKMIPENWARLKPFLGSLTPEQFYEQYMAEATDKDAVFHRELGEKIAREFINLLVFHVANENGNTIGVIPIDASISSRYYRDGVLKVTLRLNQPTSFGRDKFHYMQIKSKVATIDLPFGLPDIPINLANILPDGSYLTVESGFMRYRTKHFEGFLFNYSYLGDDLTATDGVMIYAGPSNEELRDPRKEDVALVNRLIAHLNDNLEYFHKEIWLRLSLERRFMLLDGIILNGKGEGRSVASLVENELIGIVGNSLVFPVAPGLNLNPDFGLKESLTDFYMVTESDPISVTVPTKGVYAEAVMGRCNSCEEKDESRFWRWEESPIPDSPTAILPIDTTSRRAEPGNLQPSALPNPIVNIQNAPNAPDPTGMAGTLGLLGNSNLFRDVTGLSQNQTNALEALKASFDTTKTFGQEAAKLETQRMMERRLDNAMKAINSNPNLSSDQKAGLMEKALNAYLGGGATAPDAETEKRETKTQEDISKNLDRVNKSKSGEVSLKKPDGTEVKTKFSDTNGAASAVENRIGKGGITPLRQDNPQACWATVATMMMRWKDGQNYTVEEVLAKAGQVYVDLFKEKKGLPYSEKNNFITALGMEGEPPASYSADGYKNLLLTYGPLWVTIDADDSAGFSAHALLITGISNDLSTLEVIDPANGSKKNITFDEFSAEFSAVVTDGPSVPATQVVHFTSPVAAESEGAPNMAKEVNEYDPADETALVINMAEFITGITDIRNYKDWRTNSAILHNKNKNGYRKATDIIQIVLHETAADTGNGFDPSKNTTSHMSVKRDATILQFNDLLEFENHASGMNSTSIGIEFVNRGWLSSSTKNGGEGIPASESAMTEAQKEKFKEANGYIWTFWGYGFNIYKPPESLDQLEKEIELVTWLTDTLQQTILQAPKEFQDQFPWLEKEWLQLVSYDEVKDVWKFKNEDIPPEAERTQKNLFVFTTGYDYLTPSHVKTKPGIISHNATYEGHSDGSFLALYTWLRLEKGKTKDKAYALSKTLMKDHWFRVIPNSDSDKRVMILNVKDANLA